MRFVNHLLRTSTLFVSVKRGWRKLNRSPVCFGAKDNQFGSFYAGAGNLTAIKMVRLYGYVSCDVRHTHHWSYWGCGITRSDLRDHVNIVITTTSNTMILPPNQFITGEETKWSKVPGYNSLSPELVLSVLKDPHLLSSGQKLLLKYGEDMVGLSEEDNGGNVCCDVYALYA